MTNDYPVDWPSWALATARYAFKDELPAAMAAGWPWPAHDASGPPWTLEVRTLTATEMTGE